MVYRRQLFLLIFFRIRFSCSHVYLFFQRSYLYNTHQSPHFCLARVLLYKGLTVCSRAGHRVSLCELRRLLSWLAKQTRTFPESQMLVRNGYLWTALMRTAYCGIITLKLICVWACLRLSNDISHNALKTLWEGVTAWWKSFHGFSVCVSCSSLWYWVAWQVLPPGGNWQK